MRLPLLITFLLMTINSWANECSTIILLDDKDLISKSNVPKSFVHNFIGTLNYDKGYEVRLVTTSQNIENLSDLLDKQAQYKRIELAAKKENKKIKILKIIDINKKLVFERELYNKQKSTQKIYEELIESVPDCQE